MLAQLAVFITLLAPGSQAADKGPITNSLTWLRGTWTRVQKEGRPAAERVIRQFPSHFKTVPRRIAEVATKVEESWTGMKVEERQQLLAELWKIRHSVDLMSMLNPDVLEQLTGINKKTLAQLQDQLGAAQRAAGITAGKKKA